MTLSKITFFVLLLISLVLASVVFLGTQQSIQPVHSENSRFLLPTNVINEIENVRHDDRSYFSRYEINETKHLVTIYQNCSIKYGNMKPDMSIDGWTIRRVQDPELYNETSINAYVTFIKNWGKMHPDLKIGYWDADPCTKRVFVALLNSTPEIPGSEKMVDGWRIIFIRAT
jgi:hypothetical protein